MSLSGTVKQVLSLTHSKSLDLSSVSESIAISNSISLSDASGADRQADDVWHDTRTLASAASETLDLSASLTDAFGDTVTFFDIKTFYIKNNSTSNSLLVGAAAATQVPFFADGASDKLKIPPGGAWLFTVDDLDGLIVNTNDQLKIEHNAEDASALTYSIAIAGLSASPTPTPTPTPTATPTPTPTPTP